MSVRDTSLLALKEVQKRLEPDQWSIYEILTGIGPAHDRRILEALNQKEQATLKPARLKRHWEINQVTARRNELVKLQLVRDIGTYNNNWQDRKRTYHFWAVQGDSREPTGWQRRPDKPAPIMSDKCARCPHRQLAIRQQAEKPIVEKLAASEAGHTLAAYRQSRKKQMTGQTVMTF